MLETEIKLEVLAVTSWNLTLYHIFLCYECTPKPQSPSSKPLSLDVHKNYTISFFKSCFYLFTIYFNYLSNKFSILLPFFFLIPSPFCSYTLSNSLPIFLPKITQWIPMRLFWTWGTLVILQNIISCHNLGREIIQVSRE